MTEKLLTQPDLLTCFPHRFENILLDTVSITGENEGDFSVTITPDDPLGRAIFLDQLETGSFALARPVALEILALAAICSSGGIGEDEMLFYAGLSSVSFSGDIQAGIPITGHVKKIGQKRAFVQYEGSITQSGTTIATSQLTAFFTEKSALTAPVRPVSTQPISPLNPSQRRVPEMTFMTALDNQTDTSCSGQFIYPDTHPLTKGHFETLPVMMGVMQIMALEELATLYLNDKNLTPGIHTLSAKGSLTNQSENATACDCRSLTFTYDNRSTDTIIQAKLNTVQKVAFKHMILPNDSVSVSLTDLSIS